MRIFGPNVVSFTVKSGQKHWYVVRAYVPPNDFLEVQRITHVLACGPEGVGKLLVGDINACLENPREQSEEHLATVIAGHGLTDQARHSVPTRRYQVEGNWMWRMWREGKPISVRGDYISGMTQQDFYNVGIREPIMPTDHRIVLGVLIGEGARRHR